MPKLTILAMSQVHGDPAPICLAYHFIKKIQNSKSKLPVMLLRESACDLTLRQVADNLYHELTYGRNIIKLIMHFESTRKSLTEQDLEIPDLLDDLNKERYKTILKDINNKQYLNFSHHMHSDILEEYPGLFQEARLYDAIETGNDPVPYFGIDYPQAIRREMDERIRSLDDPTNYLVSKEPERLKHMVDTALTSITPLLTTGGVVLVSNMGPQHCLSFAYHLHTALSKNLSNKQNPLEIELIPMYLRTKKLLGAKNPRLARVYELAFSTPFPAFSEIEIQHLKTDTTEMKAFYKDHPMRELICEQDLQDDANFFCPEFDKLTSKVLQLPQEEKTHI